MSFYIIDIEADGPIPYKYSMISLGAVKITEDINTAPTFYQTIRPISEIWIPESLSISGFTREETLTFEDPKIAMQKFYDWIKVNNNSPQSGAPVSIEYNTNKNGRPVFLSDNNSFDFAWVNWYFHYFLGENPFGWSSRRIGDFYAGLTKEWYATWKHLRKTKHTHNALDDAIANATAFLEMIKLHDIKISLK